MFLPRVILRVSKFASNASILSKTVKSNNLRLITTTNHLQAERLFTDKHEWIQVEGSTGVVGISEYAQEALGDVVFAQLPDANIELSRGDECGALESVKAASEIYSPVSGKVVAKNENVEATPALINSSCYEQGWLYKIELKDLAEIKNLMTEQQYKDFLKAVDH